jgi:hypothetical protein
MGLANLIKLNSFLDIFKVKINALFTFILLFSIIYLFLDDKHFSGVNFIKDAIKEEVIKKKIEKNIKETLSKNIDEPFTEEISMDIAPLFNFEKKADKKEVDKKIDKVTEDTEKEVEEEELAVEKIESTTLQKLFDRLYFSIITSTLLGYGDIYPITNISKTIVMIQSLLTITLIIV